MTADLDLAQIQTFSNAVFFTVKSNLKISSSRINKICGRVSLGIDGSQNPKFQVFEQRLLFEAVKTPNFAVFRDVVHGSSQNSRLHGSWLQRIFTFIRKSSWKATLNIAVFGEVVRSLMLLCFQVLLIERYEISEYSKQEQPLSKIEKWAKTEPKTIIFNFLISTLIKLDL